MTIAQLIETLKALPRQERTISVSEAGVTHAPAFAILESPDFPDICVLVGDRINLKTQGQC